MEIGDEIYDEIGRDSDGEQIGELLGRESHDGIAVLQRYRDQRGYSLLTYAVCRENLKALRSLVQYTSDAGIEIGAGGGEHDNLLIEAINGSTTARGKEILTYVLEVLEQGLCHVNIAYDYASNSGKCALHVAAQMGAEAVFLALSKSEGFPNQVARSVDRDGRNALHFAVEAGHRETVEVLLTVAPRLASQFDNRSETPLHKAVEKLNIEVLRYALRLNPHLIKEHRSPGNSLYRKAVDKKTTGEKMNLSSESLTPTSSIAGLSRSQGPHRHQRTTRTASYYTKVDNIVELLKERTLRCPDASIEEIRKLLYGDKHCEIKSLYIFRVTSTNFS
jgi:ankyrin repeat protein